MKANEPHDFDPFLDGTQDHDRCRVCSAKGHCPTCNTGSWGYGHVATDDKGMYYKCGEPKRWEAQELRRKTEHEIKERAELARLQAKYGDA